MKENNAEIMKHVGLIISSAGVKIRKSNQNVILKMVRWPRRGQEMGTKITEELSGDGKATASVKHMREEREDT